MFLWLGKRVSLLALLDFLERVEREREGRAMALGKREFLEGKRRKDLAFGWVVMERERWGLFWGLGFGF